jgi:hypothetical protein
MMAPLELTKEEVGPDVTRVVGRRHQEGRKARMRIKHPNF